MSKLNSHLRFLESESIYIFREAFSELENCCLLFSGGKDSIVMAHLAIKAFWPLKVPFPLLHIDTGHNFIETLDFRNQFINDFDFNLLVGDVIKSMKQRGLESNESRNREQSFALLDAIKKNKFDCCFGGGRRDEEKARAKERIFSHRNVNGIWEPENQQPEMWNLYNTSKRLKEHYRVFPISNWTERDIWEYVARENIQLPSLYYSHKRLVYKKENLIYAYDSNVYDPGKVELEEKIVRFRTIGDISCSTAIESLAQSPQEVLQELSILSSTERGGRADDTFSETSMEDRKKEGYF